MRAKTLFLASAVGAIVLGCSGASTGSPTVGSGPCPTARPDAGIPGGNRIAEEGGGFAVTLPPDWVVADPATGEPLAGVGPAPDAAAADMLKAVAASTRGAGFRMLAADLRSTRTTDQPAAAVLNVAILDTNGDNRDAMLSSWRATLREAGVSSEIREAKLRIAGTDAFRLAYRRTSMGVDGTLFVTENLTFGAVNGNRAYVLTFETPDVDAADEATIAESIAASLEILDRSPSACPPTSGYRPRGGGSPG